MNAIDASFYSKNFNVSRYMLRYIVGASTDELRQDQLDRIVSYREIADREIGGVIEDNYINFNSSLAMFTTISNQNRETSEKLDKVSQRCTDGKIILGSKTKNLRELLLQKYEAKKVIELIDEIQFIETAPVKIKAYLAQKKYTTAVETFNQALDLVFTDKLVAFHALTGLRTSLMECKQIIEDDLVQALLNITFLKETIQSFHHKSIDSATMLEQELLNETVFETEYRDCIANQNSLRVDGLHLSTGQRASHTNEMKDAVNAVKRLRREVEVLGELQNSTEAELELIVEKVSFIYCSRNPFNKSVENEQIQFGQCEHTKTLQSFLALLLNVFRRVTQRSLLISYYFTSDGSEWRYSLQCLLTKISNCVHSLLNKYMDTIAASSGSSIDEESDGMYSDLKFFKFEANRKKSDEKNANPMSSGNDGIWNPIASAEKKTICLPSVFHFPFVYAALMQFTADLEHFQALYTRETSSCNEGTFRVELNRFIIACWIPRVELKAKQFLTIKQKTSPTMLPIPSDTNFQLPSTESLMQIAQCICQIVQKMPSYEVECVNVLDSTFKSWIGQIEAIVKVIHCFTLKESTSAFNVENRLNSAYFDSEIYKKAKGEVAVPYQMTSKTRLCGIYTDDNSKFTNGRDTNTSSTKVSNCADNISSLPILFGQNVNRTTSERIMEHEFELERPLYNPNVWKVGGPSLVTDMTRISILAYICSASDMIAFNLQHISVYPDGPAISSTHALFQSTCLRCSELADTCLFFIRREARLHCFFFLTQLISQRYDSKEDVSVAQHFVQSLNRSISSMEHALNPFISIYKVCFIFNDIDALCANILISNLQNMVKCVFTTKGVAQMLLNIGAIHQRLSGVLFPYPQIGSIGSFYHFQYAKRYYQLLLLQETQLELFVLDNRKIFTANAFRALWRVETPHRVLKQGSINKLESLLSTSL